MRILGPWLMLCGPSFELGPVPRCSNFVLVLVPAKMARSKKPVGSSGGSGHQQQPDPPRLEFFLEQIDRTGNKLFSVHIL